MSGSSYKTSRLLWFVLSLLIFLLNFYGIDYVSDLFSGRLRLAHLLTIEFFLAVIISLVAGWLLQCAIVIVFSKKRKMPNPEDQKGEP